MLLSLDEELAETHVGLHVKWLIFLSEFKETRIFTTKFRKFSTNIEFHNSLSSGTARRDEANANAPFFCYVYECRNHVYTSKVFQIQCS